MRAGPARSLTFGAERESGRGIQARLRRWGAPIQLSLDILQPEIAAGAPSGPLPLPRLRTDEAIPALEAKEPPVGALASLLQNIDQGVAIYDRDLVLRFCNARYRGLLALDAALCEVGRSTLNDLALHLARRGDYGSGDPAMMARLLMSQLRRDRSVRIEGRTPAGGWTQAAWNGLPDGGVAVMLTDITSLKQTEAALRASRDEAMAVRERLATAIESISEGFVLWDAEDRLVMFNSRYRDEYSFAPDYLRPGIIFESLLREGVRRGAVPHGYDAETWLRDRLDHHRNPRPTFVVERPDGRSVLITEYRTRDGGVVGIRTDVTELVRRERDAKQSRQLLRDVVDAVPAIINVKDRQCRYVLMNKFQGKVYGVDPAQALGQTSADIVGQAYGGGSRDMDEQVFRTGQPLPWSHREFDGKDGRTYTWLNTKIPLTGESGEIDGVLTVALDITALRETERARTNLARYLPPNLVDVLARQDEPLGPPRAADIGVLFADIVDFTRFSAEHPPDAVFALLREFQSRLARVVFASGGTLDEFTGDGLMATFGTPFSSGRDAANAMECARGIAREIAQFSRERIARGEPAVRASIGVHWGPALMGDIGDAKRMKFSVVGDTVNVASRLERLTRELDATIAASDAVCAQAVREGASLEGFASRGAHTLRGRDAPIDVWTTQAAA